MESVNFVTPGLVALQNCSDRREKGGLGLRATPPSHKGNLTNPSDQGSIPEGAWVGFEQHVKPECDMETQ